MRVLGRARIGNGVPKPFVIKGKSAKKAAQSFIVEVCYCCHECAVAMVMCHVSLLFKGTAEKLSVIVGATSVAIFLPS